MRRKLSVAAIWLLVWAAAARAVGQELLLPSPLSTARALGELVRQAVLWQAVGWSMLRILAGFGLGAALGAALAVLTCRFTWAHDFFAPMLSVIRATPVASFIVLALVWLRSGGAPVLATALVVLPLLWANLSEGIRATDPRLLEMARAFGLSRGRSLREVWWPSVLPYARAAVMASMGMAWKAGIAAEVIATPRLSLGRHLYDAKIYLDTPGLFATTAVIIALSMLLERAAVRAMGGRGRGDA